MCHLQVKCSRKDNKQVPISIMVAGVAHGILICFEHETLMHIHMKTKIF